MTRGRVLVVDDEPDVVETMRDIVQALGYEASSASSGEAAMMMMATIQPHVILLDLMMPGISGLEALIYFREHHPAVPVIIITVNVDHEPAPQARAAGAFAVVEKPYDMAPLGQLLARAMEQAPPG
jgi:CheY-like chemotaxis protein